MLSKVLEFFSRLWATIQVFLASDRKTKEEHRRKRANVRYNDYIRRRNHGQQVYPASPIHRKELQLGSSNCVVEDKALEAVIQSETLNHLKESQKLQQRQYYRLTFASSAFMPETDAFAYVQASNKSAVVFLFEPSSKDSPYQAYWVQEDGIVRLKEEKTLKLAERIFAPIAQAA